MRQLELVMFEGLLIFLGLRVFWSSQLALVVKNPRANGGDMREVQSLGQERSPGGGHGNPLQHSCLENAMDRGAWWAMVHRVI